MKVLIVILLFFLSPLAMSQNDTTMASISGHLKDYDTFQPIPFRCVRLLAPSGRLINGACADFDGNYVLNNVPLGIYTLKIIEDDYEIDVVENVRISAARNYVFDFILVKKPIEKKVRNRRRRFRKWKGK